MLTFLINNPNANLENMNFSTYIMDYLVNGGMTQDEVQLLIETLTL